MAQKLTSEEKLQLKLNLNKAISKWLDKETMTDNNLGWLPEDITSLMSDSAFAVLEATVSLNAYMEEEQMLK